MNAATFLVYTLLQQMSWLSMDASNGFHSFDSNSICFYQLRDDSPSNQQPPLFHLAFAEPFYERSINFAQLAIIREPALHQEPPKDQYPQEPSTEQAPEEQTPQWQCSTGSTRKGLKCLAELLVKMLKKRTLQQSEIVPLIESILCKGKQQDGGKEERNVKRRIYDALNVMIAAGLLEKEDTEIKIKEQQPSNVLLDLEPANLIQEIQARVDKKRELLSALTLKKKALQHWCRRNKGKAAAERLKQLLFPLIFVMQEGDSFWMHNLKDCVLMKAKALHLFSETDIIEKMYELQTENGDSFSEDSN